MLTLAHLETCWLTSMDYSGEQLAAGFQRSPNRRALADYFEIISEPVAVRTVRVGRQEFLL